MKARTPVLGEGFGILVMVTCLCLPCAGLVVDWLARNRQKGDVAK